MAIVGHRGRAPGNRPALPVWALRSHPRDGPQPILFHRLAPVARVAERLHVAEVETPRIVPSRDRQDVVAVQMPLAGREGGLQLLQRRAHQDLQPKGLRLEAARRHPPAPHAAPAVPLEADRPEGAVSRVVAAFDRRAAPVVIGSLPCLPCRGLVCWAAPAIDGHGAATRLAAATFRQHRHRRAAGLSWLVHAPVSDLRDLCDRWPPLR